jgi:hypothetical protein
MVAAQHGAPCQIDAQIAQARQRAADVRALVEAGIVLRRAAQGIDPRAVKAQVLVQ